MSDGPADDLPDWAFDPDPPEPECCQHCGKELEDFSELGCAYCDGRHPAFGTLD